MILNILNGVKACTSDFHLGDSEIYKICDAITTHATTCPDKFGIFLRMQDRVLSRLFLATDKGYFIMMDHAHKGDTKIGKGSFKVVSPGVDVQTANIRAIAAIDLTKVDLAYVKRESKLMQLCEGASRIVQLIATIEAFNQFYMVMEYCAGGDLLEAIKSGKIEGMENDLSHQLLKGIEQVHSLDIIHRDLKPANVLLVPRFKGFLIKIADFGLACEHSDKKSRKKSAGTVKWVSPEIAKSSSNSADFPNDIWSVGLIIHNIFSKVRCPFQNNFKANPSRHLRYISDLTDPAIKSEVSHPLFSNSVYFNLVVQHMLKVDPSERLNIGELVALSSDLNNPTPAYLTPEDSIHTPSDLLTPLVNSSSEKLDYLKESHL